MRKPLAVAAVVLAAGALLLTTGAVSLARNELRRAARARHAARGETELRLVNPAGAALALFRAGDTLDEAAPLPLPAGEIWLPEGRYFVEATLGERRLLFPVTLDGSGEGPDEDGSWPVTVRRPAPESPPLLDERVPGFVFVPGGFFLMGDRQNPGQPHPVWVPSFHIAGVRGDERRVPPLPRRPARLRRPVELDRGRLAVEGERPVPAHRPPHAGGPALPALRPRRAAGRARDLARGERLLPLAHPAPRRGPVALPHADRGRVGEGGARPRRVRLRPRHGAVRAAVPALQLEEEPRRRGHAGRARRDGASARTATGSSTPPATRGSGRSRSSAATTPTTPTGTTAATPTTRTGCA